jgi:NAD(P)-dependent dehydrogenase (short-subunit alcohol dehydrogenase family)
MGKLQGKVIVVTGGSEGIGFECVKEYLKEGAEVAIFALKDRALENAKEALGERVLAIGMDCSKESEVKEAMESVVSKYGKIDAVQNNAGIVDPSKSLDETSSEEWDRLFNVNLKSIFWTTKYAISELKKSKGCILSTSSMTAQLGQPMHAVYTATKGAIDALTRSMALDYAPFGIRVNAIAPAGVWTGALNRWCDEQPNKDEIVKYLDDIHPLGYCPKGDVIGTAAAFLLSDDAKFMTGQIMNVGGGAELGYRKI